VRGAKRVAPLFQFIHTRTHTRTHIQGLAELEGAIDEALLEQLLGSCTRVCGACGPYPSPSVLVLRCPL
jgi:hypothetical protein